MFVEVEKTMQTTDEAIACFNARGYFAWAMDPFAPGALFAATSRRTDDSGANWLQGSLVAVYPHAATWTVAPVPDMGMGPQFDPLRFQSWAAWTHRRGSSIDRHDAIDGRSTVPRTPASFVAAHILGRPFTP